ncbi:MAG: asparagine synthetase B, partial [Gemmatimonadetes bacterium]|nr:asparagine synthetase B [Gemmatimonadota bacterium]
MCGLTGIYHYKETERAIDEAVLRAATSVVSYRGPDDAGYFVAGPVGLGHRRLSIIDLNTGDQPIRDERGNTLIFNGEIYNYIELREVLRTLGHTFKTESDTEVVLAAYRQWGTDCQKHLNGMWAFALWDPNERALFVSRDRIGEKPLYYSTHGDRFVFGSEIKCLLEAGVPGDADLSFLEVYLCLSYVPAPHTFFKHVR